jgi:cytochrome c oxidase cbb3-type subunit 3
MKRTSFSVPSLLMLALMAFAGSFACRTETHDGAVAGAPPAAVGSGIDTPVGPLPGPGEIQQVSNPYETDAVALAEGRRLFVRMNCSGCHGGHAGGGMGPSLRDKDWIYGSSAARIHDSIVEGRAHGMPTWGTKLPDEQIWKLTAYIQSLGTAAEPQPPR